MRRSSALLICSGLLVTFSSLTGCRSDPGLWSMNYKPMSNYEPIEREPSEVRFERVMSVDELKLVPQEEGLIIIGMTRFTTAPCLEPDESGAGPEAPPVRSCCGRGCRPMGGARWSSAAATGKTCTSTARSSTPTSGRSRPD
ncbi:MAG: hypothetical protein ACFHWZ_10050 [Phycisphaerales bacterium]